MEETCTPGNRTQESFLATPVVEKIEFKRWEVKLRLDWEGFRWDFHSTDFKNGRQLKVRQRNVMGSNRIWSEKVNGYQELEKTQLGYGTGFLKNKYRSLLTFYLILRPETVTAEIHDGRFSSVYQLVIQSKLTRRVQKCGRKVVKILFQCSISLIENTRIKVRYLNYDILHFVQHPGSTSARWCAVRVIRWRSRVLISQTLACCKTVFSAVGRVGCGHNECRLAFIVRHKQYPCYKGSWPQQWSREMRQLWRPGKLLTQHCHDAMLSAVQLTFGDGNK